MLNLDWTNTLSPHPILCPFLSSRPISANGHESSPVTQTWESSLTNPASHSLRIRIHRWYLLAHLPVPLKSTHFSPSSFHLNRTCILYIPVHINKSVLNVYVNVCMQNAESEAKRQMETEQIPLRLRELEVSQVPSSAWVQCILI